VFTRSKRDRSRPQTRSFCLGAISLAGRYLLVASGIVFSTVLSSTCCAQDYRANLPIGHPAIQYSQGPIDDPVARLVKDIESGKSKLESRSGGLGYLPSLLEQLKVNPDSQALVFSKTSFQAPKISPSNPRAIYFGDDVAVGFVRGGDGIELAATDPKLGVVFYTLNVDGAGQPAFTRSQVCLRCHQGAATSGVPGMFVGSVIPDPTGKPDRSGAIITDQSTSFEDRWGGWYVNAVSGEQRDRANSVASNPAEPDVLDAEGRQNLTNLFGKFSPAGYLSPVSDIVALMTFEHQTQMTNYITRIGWETRIAEQDGNTDDLTRAQINSDVEALLAYMLFANEVALREPIQGVSSFTQTFPKRGPRDHQGRSLRDFDLQKRLFRYPLSYMVYSRAFDALPFTVRGLIYQRLYVILTGHDQRKKFASLSNDDRRAVLEILRDTKPDLPPYWHDASRP
jgi:hypothetical protein